MNSARFEQLLERTMGLMSASIGSSAVGRAVALRMSANGLLGEDAYWEFLQRSRAELQELIEAVVVPETWFFRDPQAFAAMGRVGREKASKLGAARALRLLSLPCSTGEEAYTMAMALLNEGLSADNFRIDAIDISMRSLALARLGLYGRNSFRSQDLGFRDRYFELADRGYRIGDSARAPVDFGHGNILDPDFLAGSEPYDIIFCRNLLIYFDGSTQARAIGVLRRLLAHEGVLFAGHSETGLMPANGFVSARIPMAFAFSVAVESPGGANRPPLAACARSASPSRPARPVLARPPAQPATRKREPSRQALAPSISELRRLADSGLFEEAAKGCERHIRDCGPSAQALLLLALISDASGNSHDAARHYRRALYLEPDNSEALGHLALLLRSQGDQAGAQLLDDRMRRHVERRAG
jgi:chemotaxis protein methyltransferase WspC